MGSRETGNLGEDIACKYLQKKGYSIVQRNYRKVWGEIDVIALRNEIMHFVEVKSIIWTEASTGEPSVRPEELANRSKLAKVARTAALYMDAKNDAREYQVDVLSVILDTERKTARCCFFEQAIEGLL
jgi:putative endonuclease